MILNEAGAGKDLKLQWVPSHMGVPGNEEADTAAKDGMSLPGQGHPVSFRAAKATIKRTVRDGALAHERSARTYTQRPKTTLEETALTRKEHHILVAVRGLLQVGVHCPRV